MPGTTLGAPHTTAGLTAAGVDVDELQLVGVGALLDAEHRGDRARR